MKITDTLPPDAADQTRMGLWWDSQDFKKLYRVFRKGHLPTAFLNKVKDVRKVQTVFKLRGYQFGNWVSNEDRYNYLGALAICLYDLSKVLKFKGNNLGLDSHLGVAFGARGVKGAAAHYENETNIINITRYHEASRYNKNPSKAYLFANTGGVGAFAHEYGHFLDYFFGGRVETHPTIYALTAGRKTSTKRIAYDRNKYPLRSIVEDILEVAFWSADKKKPSTFYARLRRNTKKDYWFRRNEIFARLFEQYIAYKLKQLKVQNSFLTDTKYRKDVYMTPTELKKVVPLFDKMLIQMRIAF